jgi:hypothetical protein
MSSKVITVSLLLMALCGTSFGAEVPSEVNLTLNTAKQELQLNINIVWTCIAAFLVFFMQPGFTIASFAWAFGLGLLLFGAIHKTIGPRVTSEEELKGLDIGEHSMEAYSGFQIFTTT